jgi:pimeloyl-ACP methyl ester carboxylesterase
MEQLEVETMKTAGRSKPQIRPFEINIPQAALDDLQERLKRTRWTDQAQNSGWSMGTNLDYMKELADYWQRKYDWRKHEAELNRFQQFKTDVDGIEIHFIHEHGRGGNPTPIILTHGWPDSFYRFHKVIPMLTDPEKYGGKAEDSFDVVVPSMPGFGFSQRTAMPDTAVADLWAKLMTEVLGYERFMAAGGDLGTGVTKALALKRPDLVTAIYLTDVGFPNGSEDFSTLTPAEQQFARKSQQWWFTEAAYNMLQSTKPQTLGYGLNDSPVGLAAWIVEKFYAWSDSKGDIEKHFTKDELLTNITIYWVTETINSSIRMYQENARALYATGERPKPAERVEVPTGVASFPGEAVPVPREWAERNVNLKHFTEMKQGGHFAALEEPERYAKDLREFVRELREQSVSLPVS